MEGGARHMAYRSLPVLSDSLDHNHPYQIIGIHALATHVLCAATRREDGWSAYVDAVIGRDHRDEAEGVVREGDKLPRWLAVTLFGYDPKEYVD
jgi:hypothetical protein